MRSKDAAQAAPAPLAPPAAVQTETLADEAISTDDALAAKEAETAHMVIRTARVELRSDTPADVVARAVRIAEQAGGFVSGSQTHGVGADVEQATATLRIPSTAFE